MKRDMDLVREILLEVEGKDDGRALVYDFSNVPVEKRHHILLLLQAGLLYEVGTVRSGQRKKVHLSWEGHDFVDAVRDQTVWEKTKRTAQSAGGWTVGTLLEIAKRLLVAKATDLLG